MGKESIFVGMASALWTLLIITMLLGVSRIDRGCKRRVLLLIIGIVEILTTAWIFLASESAWIIPVYTNAMLQVLLVTLYIYDRSKKVYNDLNKSGRIRYGKAYWWYSIAFLGLAIGFYLTVYFNYDISSFFDADYEAPLTYTSIVLLFFSWVCLVHFLNIIRRTTPNATISRMFWSLLATTVFAAVAITFWYVFLIYDPNPVNRYVEVFTLFSGSEDITDWNDAIDSLDDTGAIAFIALTLAVFFIFRLLVASSMGYILCDVCGCTNPNDLGSISQESQRINFISHA